MKNSSSNRTATTPTEGTESKTKLLEVSKKYLEHLIKTNASQQEIETVKLTIKLFGS
tara:strand:+ start:353 stop:523 length:171 start_codon:yes stop_codon:yes gene_type:complete